MPRVRPLVLAFAISGGCAALAGALASLQGGSAAPQNYEDLLLSGARRGAGRRHQPLRRPRHGHATSRSASPCCRWSRAGLAARGSDASVTQLVTGALLITVIAIEFIAARARPALAPAPGRGQARSAAAARGGLTDRKDRVPETCSLDGKIAIVTGAATGIGSATAALFVDDGAQVLAADIKEPGDELAATLERDARRSCASGTSTCTSEEAWAAGLAACRDAFGRAERARQQRRPPRQRQAGARGDRRGDAGQSSRSTRSACSSA